MLYYLDTVIVIYAVEGNPVNQQRALRSRARIKSSAGTPNRSDLTGPDEKVDDFILAQFLNHLPRWNRPAIDSPSTT
jgi:hypothetical protein